MFAQHLTSFGPSSRLIKADVPIPLPGPGQVLIKVCATSVNPVDLKIRDLGPKLDFSPTLPAIPGMDVSGTVEAVGQDVVDFQTGDRVFGCCGGLKDMDGALAEYMLADARLIAHAPKSLDLAEAATLPLVSITAWEALALKARLQPTDTLLVHAGAGGVGHVALQLARARGVKTWSTVSNEEKAEYVDSLGAVPILYPVESVDKYVSNRTDGRGFDVVFDTVGGGILDASFQAAANYGRVVSTATRSSHDLSLLHARSLSLHVVFMLLPMITDQGRENHGQILSRVARMVDQKALAPLIDHRIFTLEQADDAYTFWRSGKAMGKILIHVSA